MTTPSILIALGVLAAMLAVPGCAEDISPEAGPEPDAGNAPAEGPPPTSPVATVRNADGSYTTRVDASSPTAWAWIDVDSGGAVAEDGPWDLAARRFHLRLNRAAGVETAAVKADFASVTAAPADGWRRDAPDANGDGIDELAFDQDGGWYQYDPATHVLTPRPLVWVIKTGGHVIKLAVDSYYADAGTSGHFRLRWVPLSTGDEPTVRLHWAPLSMGGAP
jgi:hypothetical protein